MIAWQVFAFIHNEIVQDINVADNYEDANQVARIVYGDDAFAVQCNQYSVERYDKYINGVFISAKDDSIIPYLPTAEEEVKQLKHDNEELMIAMADILGGATNA